MGLSITRESNNGYNPEPEMIPLSETEVVENDPPTSTTLEESPEKQPDITPIQLRNFIPDTEEDFEIGFRKLREHEYQSLGIPKDRSLYRTREEASLNLFKISAARVGQHLTEMMTFKSPPNYFWDSYGMTPECAAEIKVKILSTARTIFPDRDWSNYKRGDLKKVGIDNPKYSLRFKYWEEFAKRSLEYQAWLDIQQQPSEDRRVYEGEWVFNNEPADKREERHSKTKAEIELIGQQTYQQFKNYFKSVREKLLLLAEDEGIETRKQVDERHMEVALNPEITEDDDDL